MAGTNDEIKSIFFSEFHPTAGPKITCQAPDDYISKELFDTIHVYIIPKSELQNRIITINVRGHRIVGCPVVIDNPKYARNALMFSLCLVFDASANTTRYEPLVKKLAGYLTTLEVENDFLSSEENKETQLAAMLTQILANLNQSGTCFIPVNQSTTIHLKLTHTGCDPARVLDHDVPIIDPDHAVLNTSQWDIATQQLLPYIDGFKHVARISAEADIDTNIVKVCLQNLVYHGIVRLVSIFQYSNVYITTPHIHTLVEDKNMQQECIKYVAKPGRDLPGFRDILLLYCSFTAGTTVRDLCSRYNPHAIGVDERRLVQYGLIKGLIRRLQKYPVKLPNETGSSKLRHLYRWFNGCHNFDEICCKTGLSYQELDEKIESDPSIVVCMK